MKVSVMRMKNYRCRERHCIHSVLEAIMTHIQFSSIKCGVRSKMEYSKIVALPHAYDT